MFYLKLCPLRQCVNSAGKWLFVAEKTDYSTHVCVKTTQEPALSLQPNSNCHVFVWTNESLLIKVTQKKKKTVSCKVASLWALIQVIVVVVKSADI